MRPRKASRTSSRGALTRWLTQLSSRCGSLSPATMASSTARPLLPMMSLSTTPSLRLATSSTFSNQTMGQEVGQPQHGVIDVRLASGHVLDMRGVGQDQFKVPFEDMPHGLPIHARGFHADLPHAKRVQPVGQGQQAGGGGRKRLHFLPERAAFGNTHARHHPSLERLSSSSPGFVIVKRRQLF